MNFVMMCVALISFGIGALLHIESMILMGTCKFILYYLKEIIDFRKRNKEYQRRINELMAQWRDEVR